jgi:hypothetical protein
MRLPSNTKSILTATGNNPTSALHFIDRLGLYSTIFTDPTAKSPPIPDSSNWHIIYKCLQVLESNKTPGSIYQSLVRSEDARYLAWILATLTPWSTVPGPQPEKVGAKLPLPFATNVAREGIKADNKICSVVTAAFRNYNDIIKLQIAVGRKEETFIHERDTLGMMIRKWDSVGGQWKVQVLFALLVDVFDEAGHVLGMYNSCPITYSPDRSLDRNPAFARWQQLIDHLESMDLMDVISTKSILDGKRLQKELNASPGPWLKDALDICMAWQLRNPQLAEEDPEKARCEAIEEVKQRREKLRIPVKKS